ncbi:hypothetical protein AAG570_011869 [Ranatra chinensis]|uniref:Hexosyltransferase n=1 Tax=Ranatra chinensis TaxID=642074 RepID=A0ABD0YVL6_9HEMI
MLFSWHIFLFLVAGWEVNVTRKTRVYVVPDNETSLISGLQVCQPQGDVTAPNLVVVVCSAPGHIEARHAIRETWARHNISSVRIAFILGITTNVSLQALIEEENDGFRDIIQENFMDTYNNLTVKSVMMLKWFIRHCPHTHYLMKTDDDMFINTTLGMTTDTPVNMTRLLIGSLICRARPIIDANSKWYNPKYMYSKKFYPNYLSGTGYVMSRDVAIKLYRSALSTSLIHLEDVFITGICAAKAGVRPRNHPIFTYQHVGINCLHPKLATNHRLSPSQLRTAWRNRHTNCTMQSSTTTPRPHSNHGRHANIVPSRNTCQ